MSLYSVSRLESMLIYDTLHLYMFHTFHYCHFYAVGTIEQVILLIPKEQTTDKYAHAAQDIQDPLEVALVSH